MNGNDLLLLRHSRERILFFVKSLIVSGPVSLTKMKTSTIIEDFELGPVICAFVVFDRSWLSNK